VTRRPLTTSRIALADKEQNLALISDKHNLDFFGQLL
jgi:hypothetical protein